MSGASRPAHNTLDYLWFWGFWYWSVESFRSGTLLSDPAHGIASHWDEWYRYDASQEDRAAVAEIGASQRSQRAFVVWLARCWGREVQARRGDAPIEFTLGQLAQVPPFRTWPAFARYRSGYRVSGVSAVVLAEGSAGDSTDVRRVEAILLPRDSRLNSPSCVAEGFHAKENDLEVPRQAAMSLLAGRGLNALYLRWLLAGERPYPRWLSVFLTTGWVAVGALILLLTAAPDPGERVIPIEATLVLLWSGLLLTALVMATSQWLGARREGRRMAGQLTNGEVRLRMNGGVTLLGSSAGLPFCLEILLATYGAGARARTPGWLWARSLGALRARAEAWAATGAVTSTGRITRVVLDAKLRAVLDEPRIRSILLPRQPDTGRTLEAARADVERRAATPPRGTQSPSRGHGNSAQRPLLQVQASGSIAHAVFTASAMRSHRQTAANALAIAVSIAMLAAMPDLRTVLLPPRAPKVVGPSSPSPYMLWVSLDTPTPEAFNVVLESQFWSRRRARVTKHAGTNDPPRAELVLRRLPHQSYANEEDGTVWIERRRHFLSREFRPGPRAGRYTLSYLFRLPHE